MKSNRLKVMAKQLNKQLKHLNKNHFIRIEYSEHPFDWVMIMFSRQKEGEWPDGMISKSEYIKIALYGVNKKGIQVEKYDSFNMFRINPLSFNIKDTLTNCSKTGEMNYIMLFLVASFKDIAKGEYYHGR